MKVMFVGDWPAVEGGIETHARHVLDALRERGVECRLLVSSAGRGSEIADGVARAFTRHPAHAVAQVWNPWASRAARTLRSRFQPDVAVVWDFERYLSPAVVAGLGGTPYIVSIAFYKPICPSGTKLLPSGAICSELPWRACRAAGCVPLVDLPRQRARYRGIASVLAGASSIVTCSDWMRDMLARSGVQAETLALPVRPPGPLWQRTPAAAPTLLFMGRCTHEKGIDILLRSLAILRGRDRTIRLRVVGDGPARPELEKLSTELGLAGLVEWLGWVAHDETDGYLSDAWALVAPSTWAEPLGLGVMEAIIRGVPVIASQAGGHAETVEVGRTGLLFPNGDVEALASCIDDVVTHRRFPEPVVPSPSLVARHDPAAYVDRLCDLLAAAGASRC